MSNEKLNQAPPGEYGVFCEGIGGGLQSPQWLSSVKPTTYEEAIKIADEMCRANNQWHYYAKPIMIKK